MARPSLPLVTPSGATYSARQIAAIALVAQVHPKTVKRHLEGYAQLAPVAAAIRSAIDRVPPIEDGDIAIVCGSSGGRMTIP
ncbi:MAG TPA: hypothetical protein VGQ38_15305 [Gaiellaceae bacterium]|jgi:hypothetical protein|nr:hypothetical protein [Gaiellaceae bacterium]